MMKDVRNIGLKELIKVCGIDTHQLKSSHIGYSVGPRINASGRLGYSYLGVQLFTTNIQEEAKEIANILEAKNIERQMIESKMYKEAEDMLLKFIDSGTPHAYWLARGFILLSDVYVKTDRDMEAKQYLLSLKSNYTESKEINNMIADRLAKLK